MGLLFTGIPVTPGLGGQTFPLLNPIVMQLATRVNDQTCTAQEGADFAQYVVSQGDLVPKGNTVYVRQQSAAELNIDASFLAIGQLPLVLEFAGPLPGKGDIDIPYPLSSVKLTPQSPFYYEINIGIMLATTPAIVPGGPSGYNRNYKIQVTPSGSFGWVGLDQPTWPGNMLTSQGSNTNSGSIGPSL